MRRPVNAEGVSSSAASRTALQHSCISRPGLFRTEITAPTVPPAHRNPQLAFAGTSTPHAGKAPLPLTAAPAARCASTTHPALASLSTGGRDSGHPELCRRRQATQAVSSTAPPATALPVIAVRGPTRRTSRDRPSRSPATPVLRAREKRDGPRPRRGGRASIGGAGRAAGRGPRRAGRRRPLPRRSLALQRMRGALDAGEARVLSRWDAQRCWQPSGAKTGAAWLAWQQRIPIQVARQRLRHARALRTLPAVEARLGRRGTSTGPMSPPCSAPATPRTAEVFDDTEGHGRLLGPGLRSTASSSSSGPVTAGASSSDPDGAEVAWRPTGRLVRSTCRRASEACGSDG